jgi:hypothetical protein
VFEVLETVPLESLGNSRRLFLNYVASVTAGVPPFIPGVSEDPSFWRQRAEVSLGGETSEAWGAVVDEVRDRSHRLGASAATLEKIEKLRSRDACCVLTGQQPGVLGGPLLTLYKLSTAVALAARVEEVVGVPCVPIYWCGSDDTDFQEIRGFHMLTRELSPVSAALQQEAHGSGVPVGDIGVEWTQRLWKSIRTFAEEADAARAGAVDRALARSKDHGELACSILLDLLDGRVAVVDGRSAAVRRCAGTLFADYVRDEDDIKRQIRDTGAQLEQQGYHAQLAPGPDSGVFLMEAGRRKTVPPENRDALLAVAERDVTRCAPGVALRNLVQDSVFSPVAVVLGPAEIAYRAQIGKLYDRFAVRRPVDFPRMAATFVPPALGGVPCGTEELVRDPAACAKRVYRDSVPTRLRERAADFESRVGEAAAAFLAGVDGDINDRLQAKIRSRVKDVQARCAQTLEAVEDAGKKIALERWPFLADLQQLVRPDDKLQERYYSALVPFLLGGAGADTLVALARRHTDELLDAHASHIVYSVKPPQ